MIPDNINSYEFLVKENQGLVYHIVNRFHVSLFDRDDLIQAGMMGLLDAIKKYDINKDVAFSTYAVKYILNSVKKEYAKQNAVITNSYYRTLIKKVQNDDSGLGYEALAKKYKTTIDNIIVAVNFQNQISYLKEEEIDLIKDESSNRLDISELDSMENQIYKMRFLYQMSQKDIASNLGINQSTVSRKLKNIAEKVLSINV